MNPNHAQARGNALFLILIAVALFAALSYAITKSGRSGGNSNREIASLQAAQAIQFMGEVASAASRLKLINGCTTATLNYDNPAKGVTNPSPAPNGVCDIFSPSGGGVVWRDPPIGAQTLPPSDWLSGYWFPGPVTIPDVGTSCQEVLMTMPNVTLEFCNAVNRIAGNAWVTPPSFVFNSGTYAYDACTGDAGWTVYPETSGKRALCARVVNGPWYEFIYVVEER